MTMSNVCFVQVCLAMMDNLATLNHVQCIYQYAKTILQIAQQMQKIISQLPELTPFLSQLPRYQHPEAIKHLIRLGLEANRSHCCKENQQDPANVLTKQITIIKDNIEALNHMIKQQCHHHCTCCYQVPMGTNPTQFFQTQPKLNDHNTFGKSTGNIVKPSKDKKREQKLAKQAPQGPAQQPKESSASLNPFLKQKPFITRHHLDDTGVREALEFPPETLFQPKARVKRGSQDYKKHIYQDEINKEELVRIKNQNGGSLQKSRRDRAVSDYAKTTSKIKPLIEKDRIRFMQRKQEYEFKQGFNKYEYSDESQMEESSMKEEGNIEEEHHKYQQFMEENNVHNQHHQSSFKGSHQASSSQKSHNKASSKKEFSRSKNEGMGAMEAPLEEYLQDRSRSGSKGEACSNRPQEMSAGPTNNIEYDMQDDVVSNSSSFSQFSINGSHRKDVGKISRRSQND